MDTQKQLVEDFKRDLPEILAGNCRYCQADSWKLMRGHPIICTFGDCDGPTIAKGLCSKHYARYRRGTL